MPVAMNGHAMQSLADLTTEQSNAEARDLDTLSALSFVRIMHVENRRMLDAVEEVLPDVSRAIDAISVRLRAGGHLLYLGAGTSGRLGVMDAAECPPTFSTPSDLVRGMIAGGLAALVRSIEGAEDDPELGAHDVRTHARAGDAVVGISASGRTPYVLGALGAARAIDALCVGIACSAEPELAGLCDIAIVPIVGPEVVTGSTRLKAGTAQKLILNMISTGVMVQLGKVYDNLMVDVAPTNVKLRDRARRIVQRISGADTASVEAALATCEWQPKTAIVMLIRGLPPAAAREELVRVGGHLRRALA